jgi:hypothetical protein
MMSDKLEDSLPDIGEQVAVLVGPDDLPAQKEFRKGQVFVSWEEDNGQQRCVVQINAANDFEASDFIPIDRHTGKAYTCRRDGDTGGWVAVSEDNRLAK